MSRKSDKNKLLNMHCSFCGSSNIVCAYTYLNDVLEVECLRAGCGSITSVSVPADEEDLLIEDKDSDIYASGWNDA